MDNAYRHCTGVRDRSRCEREINNQSKAKTTVELLIERESSPSKADSLCPQQSVMTVRRAPRQIAVKKNAYAPPSAAIKAMQITTMVLVDMPVSEPGDIDGTSDW